MHRGRNNRNHQAADHDASDNDYSDTGNYGDSSFRSEYSARPRAKGKARLSESFDKAKRTFLRGQQGSRTDDTAKTQRTPIAVLPTETLALIFARLTPSALKVCSLVCREWLKIVEDDATWKAAFLWTFNIGDNDLARIPGKRLSQASWRAEFTLRHELVQRWTKSRTTTVTHDPKIGNVTCIHADIALQRQKGLLNLAASPATRKGNAAYANDHGSSPSMLSVSVPRGIASRSDPYNGKLAKGGHIVGAPLPAFLAGLANIDAVTSACIAPDGGDVVWGMANGAVHVSRTGLGRVLNGQGQRAAIPTPLGTAVDNHFGPVTAITFFDGPDLIATTATDGAAKLWSIPDGRCVWTSPSEPQRNQGPPDGGNAIAAVQLQHARNLAVVAVGTDKGLCKLYKVDLSSGNTLQACIIACSSTQSSRTEVAVARVFIDRKDSSVLVHYEGAGDFLRIDAFDRLQPRTQRYGHDAEYAVPLSAFAVDFGGTILVNGAAATSQNTQGSTPAFAPLSLSYIIAGDDQGQVSIWPWTSQSKQDDAPITPIRQLRSFDTRVTAIAICDLLHIVGTADGTVRIYDIISGSLIRTFNERSAPRQALLHIAAGTAGEDQEARWAVTQIVANNAGFVASIGARVLAWRIGDGLQRARKSDRSGGRLSTRGERYRADIEMRQDLRESSMAHAAEQADLNAEIRQLRNAQNIAGVPQGLGDMTEDEAVALAIMLSRQDEEERQNQMSFELSIDEDLDHLRLDEEEESDGTSEYMSPHASTSQPHRMASASSSPHVSRQHSYASSPAGTLSPPLSAARSYGNSRLQISPRLSPQYWSPRSVSPAPDLHDIVAWPLPSPVANSMLQRPSSVTSPALVTSSLQQASYSNANQWSNVARAAPPTGASSTQRSLLSDRFARSPIAPADEMDDDLRFALELSRAEEESRRHLQKQS